MFCMRSWHRRLLHSESGCYGCVYRQPDGSSLQAKGKVLLCCGGFLADAGLLRRHRPVARLSKAFKTYPAHEWSLEIQCKGLLREVSFNNLHNK